MPKPLNCFILLFLLSLSSGVLRSEVIPEDNTVAMIRANYLYQFANNNNWPLDTKKGKFYVAILGNMDVFDIMSSRYGTKPIGSQSLDVIFLKEAPNSSAYYHIIYVDKSRKADLPKIVKEFKDKSTLIVTNWDGALAQGADINFRNVDGSIRFELSKTAMENKKITPGIKILQWAIQ